MKNEELKLGKKIKVVEVEVQQNPVAAKALVVPGKIQLMAGTEVIWKVFGKESVLIEFSDASLFGQLSIVATPDIPAALIVQPSAPETYEEIYKVTCEVSKKEGLTDQSTEPLIIIGN
jgi:hypothetical protein